MIGNSRSNHIDASDLSVLNKKGFCDKNAGGPVETAECKRATIRQRSGICRTLIKNDVGPDNSGRDGGVGDDGIGPNPLPRVIVTTNTEMP